MVVVMSTHIISARLAITVVVIFSHITISATLSM
jgi:hypothetical protein